MEYCKKCTLYGKLVPHSGCKNRLIHQECAVKTLASPGGATIKGSVFAINASTTIVTNVKLLASSLMNAIPAIAGQIAIVGE